MSGLCLLSSDSRLPSQLRLVDLAGSETMGSWSRGSTAVAWCYPEGSNDWLIHRSPDRLFLLHGTADRLPHPGESASDWLPGRWGSFRGIEVDASGAIRVFADPWGSRPMFYAVNDGQICVADKLLTLRANGGGGGVHWGVAFEAMVFGTAYSGGNSLAGTTAVKPGQLLHLDASGAVLEAHHPVPAYTGITERQVLEDPSGTLLQVLRTAISETWPPDAWMLLSGGLDSRIAMVFGGEGRSALSVTDGLNLEGRTAARIAHHTGARFLHWNRDSEDQYAQVFRDAVWLTASMYDSLHAHHLGMARGWREHGVTAVATAYLFDVLLKGSKLLPPAVPESVNPVSEAAMGNRLLRAIQVNNGRHRHVPDDVMSILSPEGRAIALEHIGREVRPVFANQEKEPECRDILERRLRQFIARHAHFPLLMTWMEQFPVSIPAFHPAVWQWLAWCPAEARENKRAFLNAIASLGHPAITVVPDSNTGAPVRKPGIEWKGYARALPFYDSIRRFYRSFRPVPASEGLGIPVQSEGSWPNFGPLCRTPKVSAVLEEGIRMLAGNPHFSPDALDTVFTKLRQGEDRYMEVVMSAASLGRFLGTVSGIREDSPFIRNIPLAVDEPR